MKFQSKLTSLYSKYRAKWHCNSNSQPLTVEEIVNDLNNEPHAESHDANGQTEENSTTITLPTRDKIDDATETLSKLSLFTDDVDFDFDSVLSKR